jgi:hypothetical integral membrane protein (TIGR02206 family)
MREYFSLSINKPFRLFSLSHLVVLLLVVVINLLIFIFRARLRESKFRRIIPIILASLLLFLTLTAQVWDIANGIWSVQGSLPFHLCGISAFLCPLMLITQNYGLYEILYFWGIAGASQALLTPAMNYAFPHFIFFQFFLSHSLIITSCLWLTFVERFRPSLRSLRKAFLATNLYALFIGFFNYFTGSNYLFISRKPTTPSLLDFLGPWPWYVVSLEFICLFLFFLCYWPFKLSASKKAGQSQEDTPG